MPEKSLGLLSCSPSSNFLRSRPDQDPESPEPRGLQLLHQPEQVELLHPEHKQARKLENHDWGCSPDLGGKLRGIVQEGEVDE